MVKYLYPSQILYGPCGSHICTPVSVVVAYEFLMLADSPCIEKVFFKKEIMDEIMRSCHEFYTVHFSSREVKNLMVSDLFSFFPDAVFYHEIAGTVKLDDVQKDIPMSNGEKLWITSLHRLLRNILDSPMHISVAVVVTRLDHTVAYLINTRKDQFCFFDPLHAMLLDVSMKDRGTIMESHVVGEEYSGIVMVSKESTMPNPCTSIEAFLHSLLF